MQYKTVQFRVSNKDELLTLLISKLEEEGAGKKGYVAEKVREMLRSFYSLMELVNGDLNDIEGTEQKIREIIRSYQALTELAGETDPYKIIVKLAKSNNTSSPQPTQQKEEPKEEPKKPKRKVDPTKWNFNASGQIKF